MVGRWILLLLLSVSLLETARASDFTDDHANSVLSNSGIYGPPYREIETELAVLSATYSDWAQRVVYGLSVDGRGLNLIRISKRRGFSSGSRLDDGVPAPAILIGGSIHGNEYLNIEDRLPRWFLETGRLTPSIARFLDRGGVLYIAPILNPDGYETRDRENHRGVDLNRDFTVRAAEYTGFQQPETRQLIEYLERDLAAFRLRLAVAMDYHCCTGALLHAWSFRNAPEMPASSQAQFDAIGRIMQETVDSRYRVGTTPQILGYSAVGSSKDFYFERYGTLAFTFEGKYRQEDRKFDRHTKMWERIIDSVSP